MIVKESFARRFWPSGNATGQSLEFADDPARREVIGVVGNVKSHLDGAAEPMPFIRTSVELVTIGWSLTAGQVLRSVLRERLALTGMGTLWGIAGAFAITRVLAGYLFDVNARDPLAFARRAPGARVGSLGELVRFQRDARPRVDPVVALR